MNGPKPTDSLYRIERLHRVLIVLFAPFYFALLPFVVTAIAAWRARTLNPTSRWMPFTILSLVIASAASILWIVLVNAFKEVQSQFEQALAYWISAYTVFSICLLPHTLARVASWMRRRKRK